MRAFSHTTQAGRRNLGSRRRLRRALLVLFALGLLYLWTSGWLGTGIRTLANQWLPGSFADQRVTMQRWVPVPDGEQDPLSDGIHVTLSPAYVRDVLRQSPYPAWLLPPGVLVDGLGTQGSVAVSMENQDYRLPFFLQLQDRVGLVPQVQARFPAPGLNRILAEAFAEDWTDTDEYLLGSYDLEQRLRFESLHIRSVEPQEQQPLYPIVFAATATGWLRYRFKDNWVRKTLKARVRKLQITLLLAPVAHTDGIGFTYRARIDTLDISMQRMAPWLEQRLAGALQQSLEQSLNRKRKRERLARKRLPRWVPLALSLEVEVFTPAEQPQE